ncbi:MULTISPECIES: hypothetical protein [unclassified Sinorhizobium]|uniref:hypothetical protein n=1 Tax=unclassified Sinorhizobium TaxID=2613772 RepID=UPI0035245965
MKRAFILFVLAMAAAISLPSLSKAEDSVRPDQHRRTVFSGERRKIDFAYDFAYHVEDGCSVYLSPSVEILKPPQHGKMEALHEYGYRPEQGEFERCDGATVLGLASYYTPDEGFAGRDSITARFSYWNGRIDETLFDIEVIEKPKPDPTCDAVNQAYLATRSFPRYNETIYELREDQTLRPYIVLYVDRDGGVQKNLVSGESQKFGKPSTSLLDMDHPKFSSCRLLDQQRASEGKVDHYSGTWRKFPYSAEFEVWISADTGLFLRMLRSYPSNEWLFPFRTALEVFDYDPKQAAMPMQ